jgi:RimJ/RimL family protein N-acetyltransferase
MTAFPSLHAPRLSLFPLLPEHLDAALDLWTDSDVRRFLWDGEVITSEQALGPLAASATDFTVAGFGLWGAELATGEALPGFCGLRRGDLMPEPELLFGFRRAHWGQGLAFEAASTVLTFALHHLALPAIGAATDLPNERSIRLLLRLGMTRTGETLVNGLPTVFFRLAAVEWPFQG